ncbi:MAG: L-histidine N(alpha)-methyltransferase [Thermoanaerobaculia bacterium]|nr:L-histidine N(alpha)-methyltransferase [Thermoanaerobaculia bacterium]
MAETGRFTLRRSPDEGPGFAEDIRAGLTAVRKVIPPRYFYDELGSALFDAICRLPEYYVTRAENELLGGYRREIAAALGGVRRLVELGSGSARKTRLLLDELAGPLEYVPVDVDVSMLQRTGHELLVQYPSLTVSALSYDFRRAARAVRSMAAPSGSTSVLFLGSTIGNLDADEATALFRDLRAVLNPGDTVLLGADLRKPKAILEPAYNDALGVTAAFNLNLLQRINRELGGQFDLRSFAHRAFFDDNLSRIEMHLVSLREQTVRIEGLGLEVSFTEGETIHTENSYKYDDEMIGALTGKAGFRIEKKWMDTKGWFAEYLLV